MNFTPQEQSVYALRPRDVLITEGSGSLATVGASAVWHGDLDGVTCFQNTLLRLRPRDGRTDGRFLGWWARSAHGSGRFASIASGANIYHLSAQRVRALPLDLPSVEEQWRIADFLDAETTRMSRLAKTHRQTVETLHERRRAAIEQFVTGLEHRDRRSSGLPWVESLPRHWETVKLTLLARMGSGHTPSRSRPELWVDPKIPWITTGEVGQVRDDRLEDITSTRECVSAAGIAKSGAELHPADTVVLCRTASAGFSGVMGVDMATSQDFVTWTCGTRLCPYYLLWCLRAMRPDLLGRLATGSTHKTIYVPDLQALRVPVPPMGEQHAIVDAIRESNSRIDQLVDAIDHQLDLLTERQHALITAAVTGIFDVAAGKTSLHKE